MDIGIDLGTANVLVYVKGKDQYHLIYIIQTALKTLWNILRNLRKATSIIYNK